MIVKTKFFGEVEVKEENIISFDIGLMGFEFVHQFVLLFNNEEDPSIAWLQAIHEQDLALPVIDPLHICSDYNPMIEDNVLNSLGKIEEQGLSILVTLNVPSDIKNMTANLKAPIIINLNTNKGCQAIVENEYEVRYRVYDAIISLKESVGE